MSVTASYLTIIGLLLAFGLGMGFVYARLAIRVGDHYEGVVRMANSIVDNAGSLLQLFFHCQYDPTDTRIPERAIHATARILEHAVAAGFTLVVPADL